MLEAAPERAVSRSGKPMKAFLLRKWAGYMPGQVLTNVVPGSVPTGVARFYADDEPTPCDIVKGSGLGLKPLDVVNDAIDPAAVDAVDAAHRRALDAARNR